LLDLVIVLGEGHARRLLRRYAEYYNSTRTHLALAKDSPDSAQFDRFIAQARLLRLQI